MDERELAILKSRESRVRNSPKPTTDARAALAAALANTLYDFGYDFPPGQPELIVSVTLAALPADAVSDAERPSVCPICKRTIVVEAHGGPHPSPGDHDPAYHVAQTYGTEVIP